MAISTSGGTGGSNNQEFIFSVKVNYKDAITKIAEFRQKIQDAQKQQKEWTSAIKDAERELKNGAITQQEFAKRQQQYQQAVSASKIAVDQYKNSLREIEKQVKNQIQEEKKQEGSLSQLRSALSKATKAYDEMSRQERNSAKGKELKNHINEITKELKGAEEETQRYYRNVGNYKNAILETIGMNSQFGNSLLAISQNTNGIQGAMKEGAASVKAFGAALMGLLSNPVVLAFAGIAGAGVAFKWWYDYNKGIAEAMRLTKEFTGLTGDALEDAVSSIQATADMFGKEYLEVLQTMDSLMVQFNINSTQAMQVINDGFVSGADLSGNLLANIQQFAPIFHDAGLSAEQMVAIIAQTRSGIFSQGGLDAISMASKRIREMASGTESSLRAIGLDVEAIKQGLSTGMMSTFDVIQQVSAAMKNFNRDSEEVGNVIKDVFGKQGAANGIAMLEMFDEMSTKIEDVKKVTGEYGQMQEELLAVNTNLENETMELFAVQEGGWEAVTLKAEKFIKEALLWLIDVVNDIIRSFKFAWINIAAGWKASTKSAEAFRNGMSAVFKDLGRIISSIADAFKSLFNFDFDGAKAHWQKGMNMLGNIMEGKFDEITKAYREMDREIAEGKAHLLGTDKYTDEEPTATTTTTSTNTTTKKPTTGGKSGKGGKTTSRSTKSGKNSTENAEKDAEKAAREAAKALAEAQKELENIEKQRYDQLIAMYEAQLQVVAEGSEEQKRIELEKLDAIYAHDRLIAEETIVEESTKQATILAMEQKYAADRFAIIQSAAEHELEEKQKLAQDGYSQLENQQRLHNEQSDAIELARLMLEQAQAQQRIDARQKELEELAAIEGLSAEQRAEKQKEINEQIKTDQQALADAQVDIEVAKDNAIASATGKLGQAMQDFASENTAFAKAGKILALGELAINTGKAISSGISSAMSLPFPSNVAAMATTIATILANIATAKKTIQSAKFSTGGLVEGAGTGTSDSISARLSNGESVINAQSTGMFAPLLSSINQMGGGVPIGISQTSSQAMGEEMLARAVAKGVAAVQPVVSVEEINKVNARVKALETLGSI